jgi:hypothetical protein
MLLPLAANIDYFSHYCCLMLQFKSWFVLCVRRAASQPQFCEAVLAFDEAGEALNKYSKLILQDAVYCT